MRVAEGLHPVPSPRAREAGEVDAFGLAGRVDAPEAAAAPDEERVASERCQRRARAPRTRPVAARVLAVERELEELLEPRGGAARGSSPSGRAALERRRELRLEGALRARARQRGERSLCVAAFAREIREAQRGALRGARAAARG